MDLLSLVRALGEYVVTIDRLSGTPGPSSRGKYRLLLVGNKMCLCCISLSMFTSEDLAAQIRTDA